MKRSISKVLFILILSLLVVISGCGTSKTNSSKQTTSTTASSQTQNQDQSANAPANQATSGQSVNNTYGNEMGAMSINVTWVDAKTDMLSPTDSKTDGIMDGHFHLTLQLPQPILIESIFIRYSEFGKELRWDWIYNNHLTPAGYNLGVYEKGTQVLPAPDTGLKKSGSVDWDLFAAGLNNAKDKDTFTFDPGSHFEVEFNYTTQAGERKKWNAEVISQ
ncbi:hypothetical protein ACHOLT_01730 [Desulfitobacterium sp. Sab5]|uniref:hypothetical protein n=1 Tax=Desulfitobacterium nosdiversum TaxID=3375356 RepID=UPI003CFB9028